jgi:hypothetical protein
MEGEEQEEEERRRMRVERALAEEEEMERRRVRAVRLLGTSPSSGLAAGYLAWVASGYSREFLCHALGDGVSASQWTVAAMDLATPGAWTQPEVFQGVDHLGDIVAAQLGQVSEDVEDAFAVAHGFMGRASDLPQGIMAFIRRSDAAVPAGRAAVRLCVRRAVFCLINQPCPTPLAASSSQQQPAATVSSSSQQQQRTPPPKPPQTGNASTSTLLRQGGMSAVSGAEFHQTARFLSPKLDPTFSAKETKMYYKRKRLPLVQNELATDEIVRPICPSANTCKSVCKSSRLHTWSHPRSRTACTHGHRACRRATHGDQRGAHGQSI